MQVLSDSEVNVLAKGINHLGNEKFCSLLRVFPYKLLPNISILNKDLFRKYVCILKGMVKSDYFYTFQDAIQFTLKFCMVNMALLNNMDSEDLLADLLQLLADIILKVKEEPVLSERILLDREIILSKIAAATKLAVFSTHHVESCKNLLLYLILGNVFTESVSQHAAEIVKALISLSAKSCLLDICEFVLKRFPILSELFQACSCWMVENVVELLVNAQSEDTEENLSRLLKILIGLYEQIKTSSAASKQKQDLLEHLMKISDKIIEVLSHPSLRKLTLILVTIILEEFSVKEGLQVENIEKELCKLPENLQKWPRAGNDIFLHLCHMLSKHSRCLWTPTIIMKSIANSINTNRSYKFFQEPLLKSIFFLYPIMSYNLLNKDTIILGDEILRIASNRYNISVESLFSNTPSEFLWVMNRSCDKIRKLALTQWVSKGNDVDIIKESIKDFGDTALSIVMDLTVDAEVADKISDIICKDFMDMDISTKVLLKLSTIQNNTDLFNRLILMRPAIPEDKTTALELFSLIMAYLEKVNYRKSLRATCSYIVKLLCFLKNDASASQLFTKKKLEYLLQMVNNDDDDTTEEILKLLKILMLVQKKHHVIVVETVEINPQNCLRGSERKIKNSLDLLRLILTSNGLIKLDENSIPLVSQRLCYLCNNVNTAVTSYVCLTILLKKNKWLAFSVEMCYFVEEQCSNLVEARLCTEFTCFLISWLKTLKKCRRRRHSFMHFPEKSTVLRYMIKSQTVPQNKIGSYMAIIDTIISNSLF